jgi:hypothetical protein
LAGQILYHFNEKEAFKRRIACPGFKKYLPDRSGTMEAIRQASKTAKKGGI